MTDERLKIWIDLGKWFVVSVGLVIMTQIIDSGFKDREVGINEIKEYDKYVSVVTDNNKIAERRLLAQYFAHITPSDKLREGWLNYYKSVDEEYEKTKILLNAKNEELKNISTSNILSESQKLKIDVLKTEIEKLDDELTPTFQSNGAYDAAQRWEELGFKYLIDKSITEAIKAFENSENSLNSYHQVYEIANFLKKQKASAVSEENLDWENIYKIILSEYGWKMPEKAKNDLISNSK